MNRNQLVLLHGILALLLGLREVTNAQAQDAQKGVEVLTRGPIHEAFVEPLTVNPRPNPIIQQKPPADIEELPPDQRPEGAHIQWIPGYFAWDETGDDYIWVSGLWRATPPGQQWMPGHWRTDADGSQWVSGYWAIEGQAEVEYLPPPPLSIDIGPSATAPDADSLYTPGCWVYRERRYLWRPGFWFRARSDWFYNPARYTYSPAGYIFSEGYWDYPIARRGIFFAPVRFSPDVWGTPGWNYQPRYAIGNQGLLASLFVRPQFNRYYFGDYYQPEYSRQGFVPWFDYRMGSNTPDPFFSYSRWNSRADAQWEGDLRRLHNNRVAGIAATPPITLIQQNEFIRNVTVNKKVQIGNKTFKVTDPQSIFRHMPVIAPLSKVDQKEFKLLPVAKTTAVEQRKAIAHSRAAAHERQKSEANLVSKGTHPTRPTDPPTKVKLEFPKVAGPAKVVHVAKPPVPVVPKSLEKPLPKHEIVKPIRIDSPKGKSKDTKTPKSKETGKPPLKSKEVDKTVPKSKEVDKAPPKSKENDKAPPKSKEKDKAPPKSKENDKAPPTSKEKGKAPPKSKENDKAPPKSKENDKAPPKSKEKDMPVISDAVVVKTSLSQRSEIRAGLSDRPSLRKPGSSPSRKPL